MYSFPMSRKRMKWRKKVDDDEYNAIRVIYRFLTKRQQEHKFPLAFFYERSGKEIAHKRCYTFCNSIVQCTYGTEGRDRDKVRKH